jgi:predicted nucleotidyltransferase
MIDPLFQTDPFDFSLNNIKLFQQSLQNNIIHHFDNCENYRNLLNYKKLNPYTFDYQKPNRH